MGGQVSRIFGGFRNTRRPRVRRDGFWRPWTRKASSFPAASSTGVTVPIASSDSGQPPPSPICPARAVVSAGALAWSKGTMPGGYASIGCSLHGSAQHVTNGVLRELSQSRARVVPTGCIWFSDRPRANFVAGLAPVWTIPGTVDRHATMQSDLRLLHRIRQDIGPGPFETLHARLELLRDLRTWAVSLMGGEPTLHPDLLRLFSSMRELGFRRRMMTTNGLLLTETLIEGLNDTGLTHMSLSIDGVKRSATTVKVLDTLRRKLDLLADRARFDVVVSAVIGSAPRDEVLQVAAFAKSRGFAPRVLLLHNADGQLGLSGEELTVYAEITQLFG